MGATVMADRIVDYTVLSAMSDDQLRRSVLDYIEDGGQPLGGVSEMADNLSRRTNIVQAMVKYESDEPSSLPPRPTPNPTRKMNDVGF